jgi:hypothetical protein
MEMRDGFIVGVFNYCDRWCETCALTSYCRVFAMDRADSEMAVTMPAGLNATPTLFDSLGAPMKWLEDVLDEMQALGVGVTEEQIDSCDRRMPAAHEEIYERAKAYCRWAHDYAGRLECGDQHDPTDPVAVLLWFAAFSVSKIRYALTGLAEFDGDRAFPPDHEGSAKVALLGIDRSYGAWQELVAEGRVSAAQAKPCLEELAWIRAQLEAAIPGAWHFVRPGFDEPEAVSALP